MLLGLNLDLWSEPLLDKAVSSFGRLLIWQEDMFHMSRAVVRVRVSNLEDIPWFLSSQRVLSLNQIAGVSNVKSYKLPCWVLLLKMKTSLLMVVISTPNNFQGFGQPVNLMPPPAPIVHQFIPNHGLPNQLGFQAWPLQDVDMGKNQFEPQEEVLQA
jgi:hypothetical protein